MLNVGELFVSLGVKGAEKSAEAVTGVIKGMGEVKSTSLEAKAAIFGTMYAVEQLFAASNHAGTALSNFSTYTGLSAQRLQEWQYAARQAGIGGEEITATLKNISTAMAQIDLNKGAPAGLQFLAQRVGGLDLARKNDPFYILGKVQEFLRTLQPGDAKGHAMFNEIVKTLGISEGAIAAAYKGVFNQQNFSKAPSYSAAQIDALNKADVAWKNLSAHIEMAVGKFNAAHGGTLVKDFTLITDSLIKLITQLDILATKLHVFQGLAKAVELVAKGLALANFGIGEATGTIKPGDKKALGPGLNSVLDWRDRIDKFFEEAIRVAPGSTLAPAAGASPTPEEYKIDVNVHVPGGTHDAAALKRMHEKAATEAAKKVWTRGNQNAIRQSGGQAQPA